MLLSFSVSFHFSRFLQLWFIWYFYMKTYFQIPFYVLFKNNWCKLSNTLEIATWSLLWDLEAVHTPLHACSLKVMGSSTDLSLRLDLCELLGFSPYCWLQWKLLVLLVFDIEVFRFWEGCFILYNEINILYHINHNINN